MPSMPSMPILRRPIENTPRRTCFDEAFVLESAQHAIAYLATRNHKTRLGSVMCVYVCVCVCACV